VLVGRGFPPEKLHVHYNGIEAPHPLPDLPAPGGRRLLFVGRLVAKKGVDVLLEAFARLQGSHPDLGLDIAGDGPLRMALEATARDRRLAVQFLGWQSEAEVAAAMARSLALVVPSKTAPSGDQEGVPTVIIEAMLRGLPVVGSHHSGIPEAIADGESGLLVAEDDAPALAGALARLADDTILWQRLQAGGRRTWAERFDAHRQSARLETLLEEIIADARGSAS
jgi:glycosyltransferase involved in cell wall biosynthesis